MNTIILHPPRGVVPASELPGRPAHTAWSLDALAGRFGELTGSAVLTATVQIIIDAQRRGLFSAWIGDAHSCCYPPDLSASGIDLATLPVVRAPDTLSACRAADALIRSGGFAVVVLDCGHCGDLSLSVQTRLAGLAKQHGTALLWIARKDKRGPRSSLASLRVETTVRRKAFNCFACEVRAVKDKQAISGWESIEVFRGPLGLC